MIALTTPQLSIGIGIILVVIVAQTLFFRWVMARLQGSPSEEAERAADGEGVGLAAANPRAGTPRARRIQPSAAADAGGALNPAPVASLAAAGGGALLAAGGEPFAKPAEAPREMKPSAIPGAGTFGLSSEGLAGSRREGPPAAEAPPEAARPPGNAPIRLATAPLPIEEPKSPFEAKPIPVAVDLPAVPDKAPPENKLPTDLGRAVPAPKPILMDQPTEPASSLAELNPTAPLPAEGTGASQGLTLAPAAASPAVSPEPRPANAAGEASAAKPFFPDPPAPKPADVVLLPAASEAAVKRDEPPAPAAEPPPAPEPPAAVRPRIFLPAAMPASPAEEKALGAIPVQPAVKEAFPSPAAPKESKGYEMKPPVAPAPATPAEVKPVAEVAGPAAKADPVPPSGTDSLAQLRAQYASAGAVKSPASGSEPAARETAPVLSTEPAAPRETAPAKIETTVAPAAEAPPAEKTPAAPVKTEAVAVPPPLPVSMPPLPPLAVNPPPEPSAEKSSPAALKPPLPTPKTEPPAPMPKPTPAAAAPAPPRLDLPLEDGTPGAPLAPEPVPPAPSAEASAAKLASSSLTASVSAPTPSAAPATVHAAAPAPAASVTPSPRIMAQPENTTSASAPARAAAQLTLGFEITSLQLTPFFKLGAVQLRPLSNVVSLHLIASQAADNPLAAGISFQIAAVDLNEVQHIRSLLLKPLPQAQAATVPQPKLQVENVQIARAGENAPIQITSSDQTSTAVQLIADFTIAAMDFTPSFEIGSLRLEPTSNSVLLRLAASQKPTALDLPPSFEVASVQLAGDAQISAMRLTPGAVRTA